MDHLQDLGWGLLGSGGVLEGKFEREGLGKGLIAALIHHACELGRFIWR